mmetsp:Transcript_2674/g.6375  ORF Transcript_2674/g.6375 Transcript_2674/m.6375 type:complete len:240 (+) Transcript_2674:152-871(+)
MITITRDLGRVGGGLCGREGGYTSRMAFTQPSFSGLLVTCAYLPQTTLPAGVTNPRSATFTSITVPLVRTPNWVIPLPWGFFFTAKMSRWKVACSSGWQTWALVNRRPIGRIKRSNFGGFRVKPGPTNVHLVTMRFQALRLRLPVLTTLKISSSVIGRTAGSGTFHLPAFSLRFCLIVLLRTLARDTPSRSSRYAGTAPLGMTSASFCLLVRSLCKLIVLRMTAFSWKRSLCTTLAFQP